MQISNFLKYITVDPVNFSLKAKILSLLACFFSIFFVALTTKIITPWPGYPMIVASMGATAIILFFIPGSPLAQPWPVFGGQIVAAIVGVYCAQNIAETSTAAATAVGVSILLMLLMRCLHPPAAATSLTPIMAGSSMASLGYTFVLVPVAINVIIMLLLAVIVNRWILARDYPSPLPIRKRASQRHTISQPYHQVGFTEQDIDDALKTSSVFIDVTATELSHLLSQVELNTYKRMNSNITCGDIMVKEVVTVEYGTEVEHAWNMMQQYKLKAVPVLDTAKRVIGIITWHDFFKFVNLNSYDNFQSKLRQFIQRSGFLETTKLESIGFIMSTQVTTLDESTQIAELIELMSTKGHRQIPIINSERRLVGMVYQANLIAALYNQQLARPHKEAMARPN